MHGRPLWCPGAARRGCHGAMEHMAELMWLFFFFFCFNLPSHPTIPLPQRHSPHCNSVGVSIGMMLPYPGRTSLHCLLWRSPRHPSIYIYKYIYVYHSSEDQAPHGAPWSRAPSPLACCQCRERPPARPVALCCRSWFGSVAVLVPSTSAPL